MHDVLAEEERRLPARPACVVLLDIDFFKRINDRLGHAAGDAVLRAVAQHLRTGLRPGDVLARWGGEEFLVLLPDTGPDAAHALVDYLRASMAGLVVAGLDPAVRPSFSAGVAARQGREAFSDAINRADKALYRAKADGRNRICVA